MPRYFFNMLAGEATSDDEGAELADIEAARIEAMCFTGQMLRDDPRSFWQHPEWQLTVTDETGLSLFSIHVLAVDAPVLQAEIIPRNPA